MNIASFLRCDVAIVHDGTVVLNGTRGILPKVWWSGIGSSNDISAGTTNLFDDDAGFLCILSSVNFDG